MSDILRESPPSSFLFFWPRYRSDAGGGPILQLNQNAPAMAEVRPGDVVWAFAPNNDGRYAVVARLIAAETGENPIGSEVRERTGRWFVRADPNGITYFATEGQEDAAPLIRSLGLTANAAVLGQAFQGAAAIRRLSLPGAEVLADAASRLPLDPRLSGRAVPRRFWWVNHKQTYRQEIGGGYIWSPKRNSNGSRNQTYDNLRKVVPTDVVFSYANGQIQYFGVATRPAASCQKPMAFGDAGANWDRDGWMVPIKWREVTPPVHPKEFMDELRPRLPARYSPLRPETGNGNQNVYLAAVTNDMAAVLLAHLGTVAAEVDQLADAAGDDDGAVRSVDDDLEKSIAADVSLNATEREALIAARRGQGRFRLNVEATERACRLSGVTDRRLLRASHIKPWRSCTTNSERLDGENGLLLTPTADHLFDRGYISFTDDGLVSVSPAINIMELSRLGLPWAPQWNIGGFSPRQHAYLAFHRANVFVA